MLQLLSMKISNSEKNYSQQVGLDSSRLLSEAESCSIAGVTLDTLKSYTQFSLLKPIIRNQKPFYRFSELTQLFNIESKNTETVPTLEKLLSDQEQPTVEVEPEVSTLQQAEAIIVEPTTTNLPAVRVEDVVLQNQALNSRVKSLEDERDWLRRRVEMLEERSAREQMLMLKEKETLSEIINATLVVKQRFSLSDYIKRLSLPFFSNTEK